MVIFFVLSSATVFLRGETERGSIPNKLIYKKEDINSPLFIISGANHIQVTNFSLFLKILYMNY